MATLDEVMGRSVTFAGNEDKSERPSKLGHTGKNRKNSFRLPGVSEALHEISTVPSRGCKPTKTALLPMRAAIVLDLHHSATADVEPASDRQ